jgi:hypothetical protein
MKEAGIGKVSMCTSKRKKDKRKIKAILSHEADMPHPHAKTTTNGEVQEGEAVVSLTDLKRMLRTRHFQHRSVAPET